jgi:cyclopropane fatty-acyl-phospholipid synthase-like methyltransferase
MLRPVDRSSTTSRLSDHLDYSGLEVAQEIDPRCSMYQYAPELYFEAGPQALRAITLAMLAARIDSPSRVLDFGCGYGRVLRYLRAAFPDAEVTGCDIQEGGVAFCQDVLGATGVVSSPDPDKVELDGKFDVIWSSSHLTHIEEARWSAFVKLFESVLARGGVLVFTVYGPTLAAAMRARTNLMGLTPDRAEIALRDYDRTGFGFGETGALGGGDCLCSPAWVCSQLGKTPELELLLYLERGWLGQDVVACTKQ